MRKRFIWRDGHWVDVTDWKRPPQRFPSIIRDQMDALVHPATGEIYDSKSAFRQATRDAGMIEMGTDAPVAPDPVKVDAAQIAADVAEAWEMTDQGFQAPPVESIDVAAENVRVYE
jgi:hypothetical protein